MLHFTIETTYRLPNYRQRNHEAASIEEACRRAVEDDDWEGELPDYETAGETFVTGIWSGADAAYRGDTVPIPSHFREPVQRKAEHFGEMLTLLDEAAQPMGLSRPDFGRWLPRAQAAVEKAKTILEGRCDPDSVASMIDDLPAQAKCNIAAPHASEINEAPIAGLETRTFIIISTGHVRRQTAALLDNTPPEKWPCVGGSYADYGWFLYAHDENCGEGDQCIPDDLFAVMTWARQNGFSHVLLDRDAEQVDDLAWYDW